MLDPAVPFQTKCSSGLSLGLQPLKGTRYPAVLRLLAGSLNQNPICLYFLFSAGSPCGCSFDDRVACLLCVRVYGGATSHARFFLWATPGMCPCARFLTCGRRVSDKGREKPALQPSARSLRFALLCTAPLCQATDNTQPQL